MEKSHDDMEEELHDISQEIGQKVKARISTLKGEPAIIFDILEG